MSEPNNLINFPTTSPLPECIGYFEIAQFMYIGSARKPNSVHRFFMRLLMGWIWHDGKVVTPFHRTHNLFIGYGLEIKGKK